jgi:hypothetical protein
MLVSLLDAVRGRQHPQAQDTTRSAAPSSEAPRGADHHAPRSGGVAWLPRTRADRWI